MGYNEDEELTEYIWNRCTHLMTRFESLGKKAVIARFKAEDASPAMAQKLLERWGAENDPAINKALSEGVAEFKLAVRNRVLRDHPEIVNRCPKCGRIARTPLQNSADGAFLIGTDYVYEFQTIT